MKTTEIMTWAGPLPLELIEASDAGQEQMTFAGPLAPANTGAEARINQSAAEPICWAGPLPPRGWESSRKTRVFVIADRPRASWAGAKA